MENIKNIEKNRINNLRVKQLLLKWIAALAIFTLSSFFTLNFNMSSYPGLIISAIAAVFLDYIVATVSGIHDISLYRAIVGFVSFAIVMYMTQFFVSGFYISMVSTRNCKCYVCSNCIFLAK